MAGMAVGGCAQRGDPDDADLAADADEAAGAPDEEPTHGGNVDAAIDQMFDLGNEDLGVSTEESACVEDRIAELDIDLDEVLGDPTATEARVEFAEVLVGCVENTEVLGRVLKNAIEAFGFGLRLSLSEATCTIDEVLANADMPARLLVGIDPLTGDVEVLYQAFETCFTPENLAIAMGEEGTGPQTYGDNERLDSMQDDCEAGELRACDLLYMVSSAGSDYEQVAVTCGGTAEESDEFCTSEPEVGASGLAPDDSPGLRVLARECEDGDLTACDLLYVLVRPGHDLENVGHTCGGRIAVGAIPDCRTRLG